MIQANATTSIKQISLSPKPGKTYWKNSGREWREEFIYFLLVDRFHDDLDRKPVTDSGRSSGFGNSQQLQKICGGTLKGITNHLDYINDLGCTALWLSPVFENNPTSYQDEEYVLVDPLLNPEGSKFKFVYGQSGHISLLRNEEGNRHFIKLKLEPSQFVILSNGL